MTSTTSSLPAGTAGSAYSQTLGAAGGTSPYTWSLLSRSLPAGITLIVAGLISGITAATGTFNFNVQATDVEYLTATAALSLTVNSGGGGGRGSGGSSIGWTTVTYDGIGRTLSVKQPDGASTTRYSYSGNQTRLTDPAGNGKTFTSDVLGNLTTVVEPDPASQPSGTLTTSYAYDWMNHASQVSMARAGGTQTRTFVYSDAGLLTSATNPENGTVTYTYSADNTLQYKHDAKGQDTVYTYDSKKRVTMVQRYPTGKNNAEDTCQRVTYLYDTNPYNSYWSQNTAGRLAVVQYYAGSCPAGVGQSMTEMYMYHPAGAATGKYLQVGTLLPPMIENIGYNSAGQVAWMIYGGAAYTNGYDAMGRLNSLVEPNSTTLVPTAQYDVAGRMTAVQYWTGGPTYTRETMSYNVNGQLTSLNWAAAPGSSGYQGPVGGIQYNYSGTQNNGQITQAVDTLSGETIGYQYDSLRRLTSASSTPTSGSSTAPWTQTYQYDGFGNLTAKVLNGTTTPIGVNAATNQLSSANDDANGNMTSGAGATLTYDVANRVATAVETSGGIEYYGYAPDNKRVFRQLANGHQEFTLYGVRGEKLQTFDAFVYHWQPPYIWFGGKLIYDANPIYQDRLGSNRASGTMTTTNNGARFLPYGEEITSTPNDYVKFATYTRDSYTGLDYADQRFYASSYGRFNTPDPYGGSIDPENPESWNRYSYTLGDPINRTDPTGLVDWSLVKNGLVKALGGAAGGGALLYGALQTGGMSLFWTTTGVIGAAGTFSTGIVQIGVGLATPGPTAPASVTNSLNNAGAVVNVGGALGAAVSGGNSTAVVVGGNVWNALSGGRAIWTAVNTNSTANLINSIFGIQRATDNVNNLFSPNTSTANSSDSAQDPSQGLGGPIQIYTAPVQVDSTAGSVPYDPSPIPTPEVLTVGGGGGPFGGYAAPDEEDPF